MSTTPVKNELASVYESIQITLSKIQEDSAKRSSQEQELISSVGSAKCLAGIFSSHPPTNDEVVQALKSAGEEEQVEAECLQRYQRFVEAKRHCFTSVEGDLRTVCKVLSGIFAANENAEESTSGDYCPEVQENQCDAELLHLFRLWHTVVCLHNLVLGSLIKRGFDSPPCELQRVSADEERSYARESALRNTVADTEKMLLAIRRRRRDLTAETEAVRATAESMTPLGFSDEATVLLADEKDEPLVKSLSQGLHELQQSSDRLRKKKAAVDESASSLIEKVERLSSQTAACHCSMEGFSQRSREAADDANSLMNAKVKALQELYRKAQECASEEGLLDRDVGNYKQLCALLVEWAEKEDSEAERIVAAEQAYHSLLSQERKQQEKLTSLRLSIKNLESAVRDASAEKQRILGEVQYLSKLISNPTVVKQVLATVTEEYHPEREVTAAHNYLRFVQKARLERHTSHE
ncbi:hypothetical protein, unknown function [Leishmania mexicana MHOM/GT/2001/U1103]|uniref:Uncharacterized protein n=1 Tax=Leishmania mexicana (strain MHOM/GT/2001/U1103) TaxID=929439 RepID=E9AWD2_LEIMU|nr:hypothetical protein, unknown function [Leishmania mexicana MHOM/GT/2001/U1103]CBZ27267.1 hypothetical protein, unknown function [Leishmania mexicana MHOM/GT/2001/U1103]